MLGLTHGSQGSMQDTYKFNFGFDIVRATLKAMQDHNLAFRLPADFFECEVVGVPGQ